MDRVKKLKVKKSDGSFTDYIPIGADAAYVDTISGESVEDAIKRLNKTIKYFNNVEIMKNDITLKENDVVETLGYYEINDGGRAKYIIVKDSSDLTIQLNNNLFAKLIIENNRLGFLQMGAYGDGIHNDTNILQTVFDICGQNKYTVYINKPSKYYLINSGLICPGNIAGIEGEVWSYTGLIRPSKNDSGYTILTIEAGSGRKFYNLCIGSEHSPRTSVNGILYKGHCGLEYFEKIRVYNLDGYGFKINAIWDSEFNEISIELCGNKNEYAFIMRGDGDSCNESVINRLQVEQSQYKAIAIDSSTLGCTFNMVHAERGIASKALKHFQFGGHITTYNNIRTNISKLEELTETETETETCYFSGDQLSILDSLIEITSTGTAVFEGVNGKNVSFINTKIASMYTRPRSNQVGQIDFTNCQLGTLYVDAFTRCVNCNIDAIKGLWMPYKGTNFSNCKIKSILSGDTHSYMTFDNCIIQNAAFKGFIYLYNCNVSLELTDNMPLLSYVDDFICYNTVFNNGLRNNNTNAELYNCKIIGDLSWQYGNKKFILNNTTITGSVSDYYKTLPTWTPSLENIITENPKAKTGDVKSWISIKNEDSIIFVPYQTIPVIA